MKNLWSDTCAEDFHAAPLSGEISADLVIIGGGFTGCSAALQAAGQGAKVVLLEAETIGYGGSGRNVGLANAGLWLPPDQVMAQMGQQAGIRLNAVLAEGPDRVYRLIERHDIQCEPVRNGTLHCAHSAAGMVDLQDRYQQQAVRKAPVRLLDIKDVLQAIGSKWFHGALRDQRAGTVQPLGYVKGLARAAAEQGAVIHEHSAVTGASHDRDWTITTTQGTVRAPALLVATNAYSKKFKGLQATPTTPVHFFQLATNPLPDRILADILPNNEGCWDTGLVMTSFRKDQAGRFILGAMGLPDALGIHRSWATRALARLFPQLAGQAFSHFWSGRIGMTTDHIPKIQNLGPNAYGVFGYSGRGISPGTVFGAACATALLSQNETDLPVAPIRGHQERLCTAKGLYYETGARLIHALAMRT
ncbi:Glycine/D-amino acid oxidase [Thalassovita litoralis]|jgi:glycine/D-amino acid oxidase-like deaminating enzyme|uniref:Glycine/D-amino acid oxidase n=1 Tax=Thalassovita litoralis TaxID=1010611 RepID=A0A521BY74_9RHOB|nr:FAD-binding oxidoreductase [Thalassovita litoralis]SMO51430.1 Glycine/D-amino acid oxidase [Thalassovita litoralis]